jgi:hypothetical protein
MLYMFYQIKISEKTNHPIPDAPPVKCAQYAQIPADANVASVCPVYRHAVEPDELGNALAVAGVSVFWFSLLMVSFVGLGYSAASPTLYVVLVFLACKAPFCRF